MNERYDRYDRNRDWVYVTHPASPNHISFTHFHFLRIPFLPLQPNDAYVQEWRSILSITFTNLSINTKQKIQLPGLVAFSFDILFERLDIENV